MAKAMEVLLQRAEAINDSRKMKLLYRFFAGLKFCVNSFVSYCTLGYE